MLFKDKCNELGAFGELVLREYDYEENIKNNIDINTITHGSAKEAYWVCNKCGNKYKKQIRFRLLVHNGCPVCNTDKVRQGDNDLYTWCLNNGEFGKQIKEEFDTEENNNINVTIHTVTYGTNRKVAWKCSKGHKWITSINTRTAMGTKCPICNSKMISLPEKFIYNALSSIIPNMEHNYKMPKRLGGYELDICLPDQKLVIEYNGSFWHSELNEDGIFDENSREVYKTKVCESIGFRLIHVYDGGDTTIPILNNNIITFKKDECDKYSQLKLVIQLILKELNIEDTIDYEYIKEYTIKYYNKVTLEDSLAYKYPELLEEWDYEENKVYTPETISAKSTEKAHWICKKCNQKWEATVYNRTAGDNGCPICSNKKIVKGINDLQTKYPDIAKEWHPTLNTKKPDEVAPGSNLEAYWQCQKCGYGEKGEWKTIIYNRAIKRYNCPACNSKVVIEGRNDIQAEYPDIAKEWHPTLNKLKPNEVMSKSSKKIYWVCSKCEYGKNGEWLATVYNRVANHSGCPVCANHVACTGFNDLQTVYPELAKEYHPTLNSKPATEVSATWHRKVYWQCIKCGYGSDGEWQAAIGGRQIKGRETACPNCRYFWKTGGYKKGQGGIPKKILYRPNQFQW